jgi:hypothetical protein
VYEHRGVPFADIHSAYIQYAIFQGLLYMLSLLYIPGGFGRVATGKESNRQE